MRSARQVSLCPSACPQGCPVMKNAYLQSNKSSTVRGQLCFPRLPDMDIQLVNRFTVTMSISCLCRLEAWGCDNEA